MQEVEGSEFILPADLVLLAMGFTNPVGSMLEAFGVDTDALSNPLEAGLEWMVRFDKPVFHGREPLLRFKARGPRSRLVGFHLLDKFPAATHWSRS